MPVSLAYRCNVCGGAAVGRRMRRSDDAVVLFCAECDMGVVADPPEDTSVFYGDDYYGGGDSYADYGATAEHSLLWARLFVEAVAPAGRVLDIGCADGHLLHALVGRYERFGVEVNLHAAAQAESAGARILAHDVYDQQVWDSAPFDVITSIATFEHVSDLRRAVALSVGGLGPSGLLLFEVPLISKTRDNSQWLTSSFEHIYYPTEDGIRRLMEEVGVPFVGFESAVSGFGSTYVVAASPNAETLEAIQAAVAVMCKETPDGLTDAEAALNVAYNLVHSFTPTLERIKALPVLIGRGLTPGLLQHIANLWAQDHHTASEVANLQAARDAAAYHELQSANWKAAFEEGRDAAAYHEQQSGSWKAAFEAGREAAAYHEQQSENWKAAFEAGREAAAYHEQQAANWKAAFEDLRDGVARQSGPRSDEPERPGVVTPPSKRSLSES